MRNVGARLILEVDEEFSKICHGIEMYRSLSEILNNRLQIVSNKLLKILFKLSPFHSTSQLHKELDILKVEDFYKSRVLNFVFLCLNHTMCIFKIISRSGKTYMAETYATKKLHMYLSGIINYQN